jgi:hypothetical protein
MRRLSSFVVVGLLLAALAVAVLAPADESGQPAGTLEALATELGLAEPSAFAATVESVRANGRLPSHYVRKGEARDLGWRPGSDLCDSAPDRTIGGDRFQNREGRLPDAPGRQWFEADLDFDCGRRGAKRLVFSNDGLIFVTTDHYESFTEVPE